MLSAILLQINRGRHRRRTLQLMIRNVQMVPRMVIFSPNELQTMMICFYLSTNQTLTQKIIDFPMNFVSCIMGYQRSIQRSLCTECPDLLPSMEQSASQLRPQLCSAENERENKSLPVLNYNMITNNTTFFTIAVRMEISRTPSSIHRVPYFNKFESC